MPESAHRRRRIDTGGPWGSGLLVLGILVATYGLSLMFARPEELRGALAWINGTIPLTGWALPWLAAGLWSIGRALWPPQRHIDVAPAVGVLCLWAGIYATFWVLTGLQGTWTRDWTGALIFFAFAGLVIEFSQCVNPPGRSRR